MRVIRIFIHLFPFWLLLIAESSVGICQIAQSGKNPFSYQWTIDTLDYTSSGHSHGQTTLQDIWGANDSLIFAVGYNTFDGLGAMWKFDGERWERVRLSASEGGPIPKAFTLTAITGYDERDIYAFGYYHANHRVGSNATALGLHYDGMRWKVSIVPNDTKITSALLTQSAILCGGTNGQVLKYNGKKWSIDNIASIYHNPYPLSCTPVGMAGKDSIYCAVSQFDSRRNITYRQFGIVHNHLLNALDDSLGDCAWHASAYWQSKSGNLYSCGSGGIYRLTNRKWINFYPSETIVAIHGTSDERIFASDNTTVYHYDGRQWMPIYIVPPCYHILYTHLWCSANEVFILMGDLFRTYVVHGR